MNTYSPRGDRQRAVAPEQGRDLAPVRVPSYTAGAAEREREVRCHCLEETTVPEGYCPYEAAVGSTSISSFSAFRVLPFPGTLVPLCCVSFYYNRIDKHPVMFMCDDHASQ